MKTIRIAIADDHMVVRHGLGKIFEDEETCQVVGEAVDAKSTLQLVRTAVVDVLVLDISMPGRSGIELIRQIKSEKPRLPILILSMHDEEQYAVRAIKAGASGYLTKGAAAEELIKAVDLIFKGGRYITTEVGERLALEIDSKQTVKLHKLLSDREFEIFKMIVHGVRVADIASDLNLSSKTVSTHKARILQKMQMKNSSDLVSYAIENNLRDSAVPPHEPDDGRSPGQAGLDGNAEFSNELLSAYRQLSAKTDFQQAILDHANFSIVATDEHGIIKIFNSGAEKLLGYRSDEIVGIYSPVIFHMQSEIDAKAKALSAELGIPVKPDFGVFLTGRQHGEPDEAEWTYVRKDGRLLSVMLSVVPVQNASGLAPCYVGIAYALAERGK